MFNFSINLTRQLSSVANKMGKPLSEVVGVLEKFAPISAAENWDNVGLLIEPYKKRDISNVLLTNDLTESVMKEALDKSIDLIISYHPPIFNPLRRITQSHWKERIVSICLAENIALYSPHTAWDTVSGGVNDWLASSLPISDIQPILCNPMLSKENGAGRVFNTAVTLGEAIKSVKSLIGLDVLLAQGLNHTLDTKITRVAVCAGSGSSVLKNTTADLFITGEMAHHDLLEAVHKNTSVILTNHSNSERGFLHIFKYRLKCMLDDKCQILVSEKDTDPLKFCTG